MNIARMVLWLPALIAPGCVGALFPRKGRKITPGGIGGVYLIGQLCLWAVFQVIAVPMIQLRWSFTAVYWCYLAAAAALTAFGAVRLWKHGFQKRKVLPKAAVLRVLVVLGAGVILYQVGMYVFGMNVNEDDSRWLAEANDALVHDTMFLHNPATGEYIGRFVGEMTKDVYSPFPMYIAFLSRLTGTRAAVTAHTVYAPVLLLVSYAAFDRIGKHLFRKRDERVIFLFAVAVIMLFFGGGFRTEAVVTLTRIWQGKAAAAAILAPAILGQVLAIQEEDTAGNWLMLAMMSCAGCLLSGMGIMIALIMIGGYGLYAVVCGRWRRIPLWLLALTPAAVFEILYQFTV